MGATGQAQRPTVQAELEALPDEILLYIFCFLSAETLSVMGQVSRRIAAIAGDNILWRRLAVARWGEATQGGMFPGSWKRLYSQLDERSCRRAVKEAEEGFPAHADLSRAVLSVEVAKRREAVLKAESSLRGPAQVRSADKEAYIHRGYPLPEFTTCSAPRQHLNCVGLRLSNLSLQMLHTILCGELHPLQKTSAKEPQASQDDEVARWRARRDMRIGGDSAGHVCRSGCAMDQLSTSVYICRMSGRVHRCGNECDSAQPEDGQLVSVPFATQKSVWMFCLVSCTHALPEDLLQVCALSGAVVGEVLEAGGDVAHPLVEQGPHDEGGGAEGGADGASI